MERLILRLQRAIDFLNVHLPLVNVHMVDFFTDNLWEKCVPISLQREFTQNRHYDFNIFDIFSRNSNGYGLELKRFFENCHDVYPVVGNEVIIDFETFLRNMYNVECCNEVFLKTQNTYMSEKKLHEVSLMSVAVEILSKYSSAPYIVDIGDGRGYLSSHLAMQKGLKVLGLDSCETRTTSAVKRAKKIQKHLIYKNQNSKIIENDLIKSRDRGEEVNKLKEGLNNVPYKQMTAFISSDTDLNTLLQTSFPGDDIKKFGIVGLHTCGNLSPACLELYTANYSGPEFLINVGCCYHLLNEAGESRSVTFPMSNYLKKRNFVLGKAARMLSLQAPDRLYSSKKIPDSLMFRAVFELLLKEKIGDCPDSEKCIGRIGSKCPTFEIYCQKALKKLEFDIDVTEDELKDRFEKCRPQRPFLEYFYLLRAAIAPVIENIILLDRLLFLYEKGFHNSYILKLFDSTASPRCFAIISTKTVI